MASPLCNAPGSSVTNSGINTPIGCLSFEQGSKNMIELLMTWGVSLATGIVILTLILASFQIVTAAGDAKKVQAGKELATASIGGLILITMGVVILNFLGVSILGLGSFGFNIN